MSIEITITEKEILENSNDFALGSLVREKYWETKQEMETIMDSHDVCVLCGKETPYLRSTHIDYRIGYVEGLGQTCYQPSICDK